MAQILSYLGRPQTAIHYAEAAQGLQPERLEAGLLELQYELGLGKTADARRTLARLKAHDNGKRLDLSRMIGFYDRALADAPKRQRRCRRWRPEVNWSTRSKPDPASVLRGRGLPGGAPDGARFPVPLRVLCLSHLPHSGHGLPSSDSVRYLFMADYLSPYEAAAGGHEPNLAEQVFSTAQFPPLYPLALALLGAGSHRIALAHLITTVFLLASLAAFFAWARQETGSRASRPAHRGRVRRPARPQSFSRSGCSARTSTCS